MSKATRLGKLEAAFPNPDQAGRRCPGCGGVTIDDALNALDDERMDPEEAERILEALDLGDPTCALCGARTLHGALAELDDVPGDAE